MQTLTDFIPAAKNGTLPAVVWIDPNARVSEHPLSLVSAGAAYPPRRLVLVVQLRTT